MPLLRVYKLLLTNLILEFWSEWSEWSEWFSIPCSVVGELIHYQSNTKESEDKNKNTPLHLACANGHLEVVTMLLVSPLLLKKYLYLS